MWPTWQPIVPLIPLKAKLFAYFRFKIDFLNILFNKITDSSNGPQAPINIIFVVCPWTELLNLYLPRRFIQQNAWLAQASCFDKPSWTGNGFNQRDCVSIPLQDPPQPIFSASVSILCTSLSLGGGRGDGWGNELLQRNLVVTFIYIAYFYNTDCFDCTAALEDSHFLA